MWYDDWRIIVSCSIALIINILTIASGAARMAGVKTKRVATGLTLFNLFGLLARLANIVMLPVLANVVDKAVKDGTTHNMLLIQFRFVLFSAFIGSIIGACFMPTFVAFFKRGIHAFERVTSIPRVIFSMLDPRKASQITGLFRPPSLHFLAQASMNGIPKPFLIYNILMTAIWAVGALASVYASAIIPEYSRTATLLSSVVNGWATVMFTLIVDPTAALITDQAVQNIRPEHQVRSMVIYLTLGTVAGMLMAQFLFLPASNIIVFVTRWLGSL